MVPQAVNGCAISVSAPESSQGYKNGDRGGSFTFSSVFPPETTQEQFFGRTAATMVSRALRAAAPLVLCPPLP